MSKSFIENEIVSSMESQLLKKASADMSSVAQDLVSAADAFYELGMVKKSDKIFEILLKIAAPDRKTIQFMPKIEDLYDLGIPKNYVAELLNNNVRVKAKVIQALRDGGKTEKEIIFLLGPTLYLNEEQTKKIIDQVNHETNFENNVMRWIEKYKMDPPVDPLMLDDLKTSSEKQIYLIASTFYRIAQPTKLSNLTKIVYAGASFEDLRDFKEGNPLAKAKVNYILSKEYSDKERLSIVGKENFIPAKDFNKYATDGVFARLWSFTKIAFKPMKHDKHTHGLTSEKMLDNLKHHGTEFNMADDNDLDVSFDPELITVTDEDDDFEDE